MSLGHIGEPLPKEWSTPLLSELTTPKQWKTISTKALLSEGYTVYGANGKIGYFDQYTHEHPTIMITCRGATCGNLHISEPFSYINGNAMALDGQPTMLVGLNFLYFSLKARGLEDTISGSAQPQITGKGLSGVRLPLAPLAEQKVIADKLDTLLSQVENTKARLERIPQILKRFRQSVLAAAVSGRLTEEWRKDKQLNAPEQLQAIRTRYPSKPAKEGLAKFHELPQTWDWALVKEVGDVQLGRQRAPKYHQGTNMRPYLRVANVMEGYIDTRDIMEMEFNEKDYERYRLSEGDILLNEGQSHELVGRPAMFKGEVEGACFTNTLVRFRPRPGVSGNFAYMVFLSYLQSGRFQQIASRTVNISHLGAGRFADMEFPFPTLEEQTEIVRRVDQLFAHADRIEQQINNSLTRVNNLTQSILAKAFRGELTEQWRKDNPELISGDNSAEALLERIKAEQAAAKPAKKIRKKMSS